MGSQELDRTKRLHFHDADTKVRWRQTPTNGQLWKQKSELSLRFQAWMTKQQSHKRYKSGIWRWKAGILLATMGWCTTGRQRQLADSWKCRPVIWVEEHYWKCRLESCSPRKLLTLELNWNYDITNESKEDKEEIWGGSWGNDGILRFKKS